ncbi:MAG: glycosyltransferase family 39 protein [Cyanobacteria bacterium P01_H01_bin.15]
MPSESASKNNNNSLAIPNGFTVIGLMALIGILVWGAGSTGLIDETEPLFAEAARQMVVTGDWIAPYFNGEPRFDKPPLIYWLMAGSYQLFGTGAWSARLPSLLSAIALMILCFICMRRWGGQTQRERVLSSGLAAGFTVLNLQTFFWARSGVSDMLLSACIGGALFCFFGGYVTTPEKAEPNWLGWPSRWYWGYYTCLGLGVLSKGPIGLVLPGFIVIPFLLYMRQLLPVLRTAGVVWGLSLVALISLPWYGLMLARFGDWYWSEFFGYHNFERFTDVVNGHSAPWYFYFLIVFGFFLPWSAFLPAAIAKQAPWRWRFWQRQPRSEQLGLFALFWFVGVFVFFSLAVTKLPSYTLPLAPAAAILVARWSASEKTPRRDLLISGAVGVVLMLALAVAAYVSPELVGSDRAIDDADQQLADSGIPNQIALIWLGCAMANGMLLWRKQWRQWLPWGSLLSLVVFIVGGASPLWFWLDSVRQQPLRELAQEVVDFQRSEEPLWMVGFPKPSVVFYSQQPVTFLKSPSVAIDYIQDNFDENTIPDSVLMITRRKELRRMSLPEDKELALSVNGVYRIVRISGEKLLAAQER